MYDKDRYIFWRNREISGEAAVLHALPFLKSASRRAQGRYHWTRELRAGSI